MQQSLACLGYSVVKVFCREQKKRRRQNGRARGFYEGKYIYLRVRLPDGTKRDVYLGRPGAPAKPRPRRGGERAGAPAPVPARGSGWRKGGEKADRGALDTRDPNDTRTRSLFESEAERELTEWFRKAKKK